MFKADRKGLLALGALSAADFIVVFDGFVVGVALPSIKRELGFSDAGLQWVVSAYLLTHGGLLLLGGRLADLFGRRRLLVAGLVVFGLGALAGGLSPSAWALVAARALQGVGAAAAVPAALALLTATFTEAAERTRALGVRSAIDSVAVPAGAVLGGLITASMGWRWVLLLSAAATLLPVVAARATLAESRDGNAPRRADPLGALLITAGLSLLLFGIVQTESSELLAAGVVMPLGGASFLLVAFASVERRTSAPLLPLSFFETPGLRPASAAAAVLPVGLGALLFVGTLYMQRVMRFDPLDAGIAYLGLSLPIIVGGLLGSRLVGRYGVRSVAVAGLLAQAAGVASLVTISPRGSLVSILVAFAVVGLAAPVAWVPVTTAAVDEVGERSGLAAGIFNTSQQLGNAVVLAVLATAAASYTQAAREDGAAAAEALTSGYRVAFLIAAAALTIGAVFAAALPRSSARHP